MFALFKIIFKIFIITIYLASCSPSNTSPGNEISVSSAHKKLSSLQITPAEFLLPLGITKQYSVIGKYSDGSTTDLTSSATWNSSVNAIATISTGGLVTPLSQGATVISVSYGSLNVTSNLTVTASELKSITVSPATQTITMGATLALKAQAIFSDGTKTDISSSVAWSSSATTIINVSNEPSNYGVLTTVGAGTAIISAALNSVTGNLVAGQTSVTVIKSQVASLIVTPVGNAMNVPQGSSPIQFKAIATLTDKTTLDVTNTANWVSSAPNVASVNSQGLGFPLLPGTSQISATVTTVSGQVSAQTPFYVSHAILTSIVISTKNNSVSVGKSVQITAQGSYSDNSQWDITNSVQWDLGQPKLMETTYASINSSGLFTAKTKTTSGPVSVMAHLQSANGEVIDSQYNFTISINAAELVSISISPPSATIPKGVNQKYTLTATFSDGTYGKIPPSQPINWIFGGGTVVRADTPSSGEDRVNNGPDNITIQQFDYKPSNTQTITITATVPSCRSCSPVTASLSTIPAQISTIEILNPDKSSPYVPTSPSQIPVGTSRQYIAIGRLTDINGLGAGSSSSYINQLIDLTNTVNWSVSDSNVTVSNGLVTIANTDKPTTLGSSFNLTARISNVTYSIQIAKSASILNSISITPTTPFVISGEKTILTLNQQMTDSSKPSPFLESVVWKTSDDKVARVEAGGSVTGLSPGTATITATAKAFSTSVSIVVLPPVIKSVSIKLLDPKTRAQTDISSATQSLTSGVNYQLLAIATYTDGKTTSDITNTVTWALTQSPTPSSTSAGVSLISNTGLLKVAAESNTIDCRKVGTTGTSTITVTASFQNNTPSGQSPLAPNSQALTVNLPSLVSLSIQPSDKNLPIGTHQQYSAWGSLTDGSKIDYTSCVSDVDGGWSTNSKSVSIAKNGILAFDLISEPNKAVNENAVITATVQTGTTSMSASTNVYIEPATITGIYFADENYSKINEGSDIVVPLGQPRQIYIMATLSNKNTINLTNNVTWKPFQICDSNNTNNSLTAVPVNGLLEVISAEGACSTLTASYDVFTVSKNVRIVTLKKILIVPEEDPCLHRQPLSCTESASTITANTTKRLYAIATYNSYEAKELQGDVTDLVTWRVTSNDTPPIAIVTQGIVESKAPGKATIQAIFSNTQTTTSAAGGLGPSIEVEFQLLTYLVSNNCMNIFTKDLSQCKKSTVKIINTKDNQELKLFNKKDVPKLTLSNGPSDIAISKIKRIALVSHYYRGDNDLSEVEIISLDMSPQLTSSNEYLSPFNTKVNNTLHVRGVSSRVVLNKSETIAYVLGASENTITPIDISGDPHNFKTGTPYKDTKNDCLNWPIDMAISKDGQTAYVVNKNNSYLCSYNLANGDVVYDKKADLTDLVKSLTPANPVKTASGATSIDISDDESIAYVATRGNSFKDISNKNYSVGWILAIKLPEMTLSGNKSLSPSPFKLNVSSSKSNGITIFGEIQDTTTSPAHGAKLFDASIANFGTPSDISLLTLATSPELTRGPLFSSKLATVTYNDNSYAFILDSLSNKIWPVYLVGKVYGLGNGTSQMYPSSSATTSASGSTTRSVPIEIKQEPTPTEKFTIMGLIGP